METKIEKLIHDTKKEVAEWVTVEYAMKQKEETLENELLKMQQLLKKVSKKSKGVQAVLEASKKSLKTMHTTHERKIQALDATFNTFKKTKSQDSTKNNGWFDANIQCTTQVFQIEKIIDEK